MLNSLVSKFSKALNLDRKVIGVNFLSYEKEYQKYDAIIPENKNSICGFANIAMDGEHIKFDNLRVSCIGGATSVGLIEEPEIRKSGRSYEHSGLYSSHAVALEVNKSMKNIPYKSYALAMGPLEEMDDVDIVMIICSAKQAMRIIQGYAYIFGPPKNLTTVGNKAVCSDMCSKPFMNNDLNFSFLCCGARARTQSADGEVGFGLPIQMFEQLANGVLSTFNVTETAPFKRELLSKLESKTELGFEIDTNARYGLNINAYVKECEKMEGAES